MPSTKNPADITILPEVLPSAITGSSAALFPGGPPWMDGNLNPPTTAGLQLVKLLSDLTDDSATAKVAADPASPGFNPGDDTVYKQISRLQTLKMPYAGGTFSGVVTFDAQPVCSDPNTVGLELRLVERSSKNVLFLPTASAGLWTISSTGVAMQTTLGTTYACVTLDPPVDQKIKEVFVIIQGGAGKIGLPGTMPRLEFWKVLPDGSEAMIASLVDPEPDLFDYLQVHEVRITGLTEYVAYNTRYLLMVRGEDTATTAGLQVFMGNFVIEATSLPAGN